MTRLEELKSKREEIYRIARKHNADKVFVFGSVARGEERPDSDIDLLVNLQPPYISLFEHVAFRDQLMDLLKTDIDLVTQNGLHEKMRHDVEREMVQL